MTNYDSWIPPMTGFEPEKKYPFEKMRTPQEQIHWLYRSYKIFLDEINAKFNEIDKRFDEVIKDYNDKFDEVIKDYNDKFDEVIKDYNDKYDELDERILGLKKLIDSITKSTVVYDPTKGKYTASVDAARRALQMYSNPPADLSTCKKVGQHKVSEISNYKCGYLINRDFNDYDADKIPDQEVGE